MDLKVGQKGSESLYANIDRVYQEGEEQLSHLKNPFRIIDTTQQGLETPSIVYKFVLFV